MNDQQLWNTLKDVQKTLKRWEKVKRHLPDSIINDTNEALLTNLEESVDKLETQVNDALSQEIRADFDEKSSSIQDISKSIHNVAHRFIMANQIGLAKEILESEVRLSDFQVEEQDAVAVLIAYAKGEKTAKEVEPLMWNKIVARIPGMCYFASKDVGFIQDYVKKMEKLMRAYKKAEAAKDKKAAKSAMAKMAYMVHPEWEQPQMDMLFKSKKQITKMIKDAQEYIKSGKALADLRKEKDTKSTSGLIQACKDRKKADLVNISQITADQVKVIAKLVEIGEEEAAKDLGQQLLANLNKEPVTAKMINDGKTLATFIKSHLTKIEGVTKALKDNDTSATTLESLESSLRAIQNGVDEYRRTLKKQKKSDFVDPSEMGQKRALYEKQRDNQKTAYSSLGRVLNSLDRILLNAQRYGRSTAIGTGLHEVPFGHAKWLVKKTRGMVDWVELRNRKQGVGCDSASHKLWKFRNNLADQVEDDLDM